MKTLNEIWAASNRALMRHSALMFRVAISPQYSLDMNVRGMLGVEAIERAVALRKEAEFFEAKARKEAIPKESP